MRWCMEFSSKAHQESPRHQSSHILHQQVQLKVIAVQEGGEVPTRLVSTVKLQHGSQHCQVQRHHTQRLEQSGKTLLALPLPRYNYETTRIG